MVSFSLLTSSSALSTVFWFVLDYFYSFLKNFHWWFRCWIVIHDKFFLCQHVESVCRHIFLCNMLPRLVAILSLRVEFCCCDRIVPLGWFYWIDFQRSVNLSFMAISKEINTRFKFKVEPQYTASGSLSKPGILLDVAVRARPWVGKNSKV